ncbi:MAG: phage integrase SAM-like domain-containing protein [Ferruginibacter sp.]
MLGIGPTSYNLVQCFNNFVKEITLKIGSDYEIGTLKNYKVTLGHLKEFISRHYHVKDIPLNDLNYKFLTAFELMCKTDWGAKRSSTSAKHIQRIRRVISVVLANEWLEKDPFTLYKSKQEKPTIKFLTQDELKAIEEKEFSIERLDRVRDMFIFHVIRAMLMLMLKNFLPIIL